MTNFYISDLHFGHAKIITLAHRPFQDVEEMNTNMVNRWNAVVNDSDTVHFLGDFAWHGKAGLELWRRQLNGNIVWYQGNHYHGEPLSHMPLDWRARAFDVSAECLDYTPQTATQIIMRGN